jgi:hypothetical protein
VNPVEDITISTALSDGSANTISLQDRLAALSACVLTFSNSPNLRNIFAFDRAIKYYLVLLLKSSSWDACVAPFTEELLRLCVEEALQELPLEAVVSNGSTSDCNASSSAVVKYMKTSDDQPYYCDAASSNDTETIKFVEKTFNTEIKYPLPHAVIRIGKQNDCTHSLTLRMFFCLNR